MALVNSFLVNSSTEFLIQAAKIVQKSVIIHEIVGCFVDIGYFCREKDKRYLFLDIRT